jgi:poly [ADP-ribose] polymerase
MELLRALTDVQLATQRQPSVVGEPRNPLDVSFEQLHAKIEPVTDEATLATIKEYVSSTHASTPPHDAYTLEVDQVFSISRDEDEQRFAPFAAHDNRALLWHGSRLGNWFGILSAGLRIAPPEAPITGHMFGKVAFTLVMLAHPSHPLGGIRCVPLCCCWLTLLPSSWTGRLLCQLVLQGEGAQSSCS